MKYCSNHSDKKAFSICHGCGKDFCELCLDEGKEYYYCKNPGCQKLLKEELNPGNLSENVICPSCGMEFILSEDEMVDRKVHCPECETLIDFNYNPPEIMKAENYVELMSSVNEGDIALIKSILDDEGIGYYVAGNNIIGAHSLLAPTRFFVNEKQLKESVKLLEKLKLNIIGFSFNQC